MSTDRQQFERFMQEWTGRTRKQFASIPAERVERLRRLTEDAMRHPNIRSAYRQGKAKAFREALLAITQEDWEP